MKTIDFQTRFTMPNDHELIYALKVESVRPYVEKIGAEMRIISAVNLSVTLL